MSSVRPSVCLSHQNTVTVQEAACDAASIHFGLTVRRTDIPVEFPVQGFMLAFHMLVRSRVADKLA